MRATKNSISSSSDSSPRRPTRKISLPEKKKKRTRKSKKRRSVSSCSSSSSSPCRSKRRRRSRSPRRHGTKSGAGKDKRRRKRGRSPVRSSRSSSSCSTCRSDSESVERQRRKKSKRGAEEERRSRGRSSSRRGGSRSRSGSTSSSSKSRGYGEEKLLRKRSDSRRGGSRNSKRDRGLSLGQNGDRRRDGLLEDKRGPTKLKRSQEKHSKDVNDGSYLTEAIDEAPITMGQWRNGSEATKTDVNGTEAIAEAMGERRNDNEATEVDADGTEAIAKVSITMGQQKNEGEATKTDANGLATTEVDDLESILRQKALENFKKFRDSAKRQVMKGDENDENNAAKRVISKPISKTISIRSEIVRVSHDIIDITTNPSVNSTSVGGSVQLSEEGCNLKEPKPVQESSNNVLLEGVTNEKVINKQGSSGGGGDAGVAKADGRASPPPNGAAICNNPVMSGEQQKVETKDGSEFQQKTMSVMRGGEAVQVSYKVYIPKKAPALARRQLQR